MLPEAGNTLTLSTSRGANPLQAEGVWAGSPGAEGRTLHEGAYTPRSGPRRRPCCGRSSDAGVPPGAAWEALPALVAGPLEDRASAPDPPGTGTGAAVGPGTAGLGSRGGQ